MHSSLLSRTQVGPSTGTGRSPRQNTDPPVPMHENPRSLSKVHHKVHQTSSRGQSHGPHRDTDPSFSENRRFLQKIARDTVNAVSLGTVAIPGPQNENGAVNYPIRNQTAMMEVTTLYFSPEAGISGDLVRGAAWSRRFMAGQGVLRMMGELQPMKVSILSVSALDGAQYLHSETHFSPLKKVGVLNFASATSPGGGFINGDQGQEESIARSSNLYSSLNTPTAKDFYTLHTRSKWNGYYSHAMIYSTNVVVFRDDTGAWISPHYIDVLTSPAVDASEVRRLHHLPKADVEARILKVLRERMKRILALFENLGMKYLVLGSFGKGVLLNDVEALAGIWAKLLVMPGARFARAFERVVFAIPDEATKRKFESGFGGRVEEAGGEVYLTSFWRRVCAMLCVFELYFKLCLLLGYLIYFLFVFLTRL